MAFNNRGAFVSLNTLLDMQIARNSDLKSPEFRELMVRLMLRFNRMATAINVKKSGMYDLDQYGNGSLFPPVQTGTSSDARPVFQQTFLGGALLNALPTTIAHGIAVTATTQFIGHEAWASDTTGNEYIPLPFVDVSGTVAAGNIELFVDGTNINIEPTGDATNFDLVVVTLYWIDG